MTSALLTSRRIVQAVAIVLLLAACGSTTGTTNTGSQTEATEDPTPAAKIGLPTADGGQIDLGSLEGSDTVLWFWAPW